ncbi:MAG: hypothetical protein RLZ10_1264 [Bacteroidota bacterium]|jgi:hypothetical protein
MDRIHTQSGNFKKYKKIPLRKTHKNPAINFMTLVLVTVQLSNNINRRTYHTKKQSQEGKDGGLIF